jgi:hypothetical protein
LLKNLQTNNKHFVTRILFVGSVTQLYQTANLTYSQSLHRATPYLMGVALGVLLHKTGKNVHISKVSVFTQGNKAYRRRYEEKYEYSFIVEIKINSTEQSPS